MGDRYWIGNSGNWSDTAHWSTSSGGPGGAAVPTLTDDVHFDNNSFSTTGFTVTLNVDASMDSFSDLPGYTHGSYTLAVNTGHSITCAGAFNMDRGMLTSVDTAFNLTLTGSGNLSLPQLDFPNRNPINLIITGGSHTWGTISSYPSSWIRVTTFDIQGGTWTDNTNGTTFVTMSVDSGATLVMTSATLLEGENFTASSGATVTDSSSGTAYINMSGLDQNYIGGSFNGGSFTYPNVGLFGAGMAITGSFTASSVTFYLGSYIFQAGSTITSNTGFSTDGTALASFTSSSPGTQYTFVNTAGGLNTFNFVSLQDSNGSTSHGSTWQGDSNSINAGNNTNWTNFGSNIVNTGGKTVRTFIQNSSFIVPISGSVEVLVVGGGAGGGGVNTAGGGGGAGGIKYSASYALTPGTYTVTVGAGGATHDNNGSSSSFGTLIATGGLTGGSSTPFTGGAQGASPAFGGGFGATGTFSETGGGGGGATNGGNNSNAGSKGGNGGPGTAYSISGSSVTYAGGGGGGAARDCAAGGGTGGNGGGGQGADNIGHTASAGTANLGGGGGGAGNNNPGAGGGSGVVILSYPIGLFNGGGAFLLSLI